MPVDWCPLFFCAPAPPAAPAPSSRLRQLLPGWRMQCTSRENPGLPSPPPPPLAGSFVPISLSFFAGCEAAYCCCVHLCICGSNKSLSGCVMENYPLWEEDRQLWQILKIPLIKLQLCPSLLILLQDACQLLVFLMITKNSTRTPPDSIDSVWFKIFLSHGCRHTCQLHLGPLNRFKVKIGTISGLFLCHNPLGLELCKRQTISILPLAPFSADCSVYVSVEN